MCPATVWIISGLRSRRKNDTTPAPELFFHEHGSSTGALGFHECGSGALFLHGSGSSSGFCSFSHINILIVLVCLKLNRKWIQIKYTRSEEYTKPFWVISSSWFLQAALLPWRYQRKNNHRFRRFREVTSKNVTQHNGNINNFWKGSHWFCLQCLKTFCYFLRQNQENGCLKNYIRVRIFKDRPVPIDQVLCTRFMLCLLQSWRFQKRWPESLFQTPTPLLFQSFWIRVRQVSNLGIRLEFRFRLQSSIQP